MRGQARRHLAAHCLDLVVGMRRGHGEEYPRHAVQHTAGAFQGHECVVEAGRFGLTGDGLDLGQLLRHAALEGRRVMLVFHPVESRELEVQVAFGEERIGTGLSGGGDGLGLGFHGRLSGRFGFGFGAGGDGQGQHRRHCERE